MHPNFGENLCVVKSMVICKKKKFGVSFWGYSNIVTSCGGQSDLLHYSMRKRDSRINSDVYVIGVVIFVGIFLFLTALAGVCFFNKINPLLFFTVHFFVSCGSLST